MLVATAAYHHLVKCSAGHEVASGTARCEICGTLAQPERRCPRGHGALGAEVNCRQCGVPIDSVIEPRASAGAAPNSLPIKRAGAFERLVLGAPSAIVVVLAGISLGMASLRPWFRATPYEGRLGLRVFIIVVSLAMLTVVLGLQLLRRPLSATTMLCLWLIAVAAIGTIVQMYRSANGDAISGYGFSVATGFYFAVSGTGALVVSCLVLQIALLTRRRR